MSEEMLGASFTIDITSLKAGLLQANRLIKESESEFKLAAAGMDKWSESEEGLEARIKHLNNTQDLQKKKVEALKKQYEEAGYASDDMSEAAVRLRTQLNREEEALVKTEKELKDQKQALEDLRNPSEKAADSLEEVADAAEESEGGFTIMKGAIANLVADGFSSLLEGCKNAISSLFELGEETREYRENLNKLKTAFEAAGKTSETATETYKDFYSILGDEDRSVEAAAHLAKLTSSQEDLAKWSDICAGVWGTFGDSLPIEGLTEASNETAKVGKLTGVLADALNWAGVNEDDFQASLDACNTEQERSQLITDTLNGLYKDAAQLYKKNNEQLIEARKATSDYADVQAELGEAIDPVNQGIESLKTEFIKGLTPSLKKEVIPQMKKFIDQLKENGTVKKLSDGVADLAKKGFSVLSKAIEFCTDNLDTIVDVVKAATTGMIAYAAALKITGIINAVTTAVKNAGTAMQALNVVMAANPAGAVATAIGLLVGALVLFKSSQDDATKSAEVLNDAQKKTIDSANEAADAYMEQKAAADELVSAQMSSVDYAVNNLIPQLQTLVDANGEVRDSDKARADFILQELNNALGTEYSSISDVVDANGQLKQSVYDVIEAKKAQILLEAYEDSYREAITNVALAEDARATAAQGLAGAQEQLKTAEENYAAAMEESNELAERGTDTSYMRAAIIEENAMKELQAAKDKFAEQKGIYDTASENVKGYYNMIDAYESASTAAAGGNSEAVIESLKKLSEGYSSATDLAGKSADEQVEILKQQVIDSEVNYKLMLHDYAKNQENLTEEQKTQSLARIKAARKEADDARMQFETVGGNMVAGMAAGVTSSTSVLDSAIRKAVQSAVSAAESEAQIKSPSRLFRNRIGKNLGLGTALGIADSTKNVVKSVQEQIRSASDALNMRAVNNSLSASIPEAGSSAVVGGGNVTVYQTNNYSQAHSRYELYKSKQQTAAAVRLAMLGG